VNALYPGFFVTGTDTGVGKTRVSAALLLALRSLGLSAAGMKPVASGCFRDNGRLRHEDALLLQAQGSQEMPYELVNPYAFEPPVSPHLAAARVGVTVDFAHILACFRQLCERADGVVVEGVGGWETPLTETATVDDLALQLNLPVILVVGLRLGCLNHAILTARAIERSGLPFLGWVANAVDATMQFREENIAALHQRLAAPCLAVIPHGELTAEWLASAGASLKTSLATVSEDRAS
jgi:dethiobiotin synthetase